MLWHFRYIAVAITGRWVTARDFNKYNCAPSYVFSSRRVKVMESVVRVFETTLAFNTQVHTLRSLPAHYLHVCMYTHSCTQTPTLSTFHRAGSVLIGLCKEVMRTFFKSITFTWETLSICVCVCVRVCVPCWQRGSWQVLDGQVIQKENNNMRPLFATQLNL